MSVKKSDPIVLAKSEKSYGWGFLSHPWISPNPDGSFFVYYNLGGDARGGRAPAELVDRGPALTRDAGLTWSYGSSQLTGFHAELRKATHRIARGDREFRFGRISAVESNYYVAKGIWIENGELVKGPERVKFYTGEEWLEGGWMATKGVELENGDLLVSGGRRFPGDKHARTVLFRSVDGGETFHYDGTIATIKDASWGREGPGESEMELLPDGTVVCVMRTGSPAGISKRTSGNQMLMAWSKDGGKTWPEKRKALPGVRPKLLLMSNGVLVMAFGRPGNNVAFSVNGGRTWGREIALSPADVLTSGYVGIIEVEPGRLFAVYDNFNTTMSKIWLWDPPDPINIVWGVFIDVEYNPPFQ